MYGAVREFSGPVMFPDLTILSEGWLPTLVRFSVVAAIGGVIGAGFSSCTIADLNLVEDRNVTLFNRTSSQEMGDLPLQGPGNCCQMGAALIMFFTIFSCAGCAVLDRYQYQQLMG